MVVCTCRRSPAQLRQLAARANFVTPRDNLLATRLLAHRLAQPARERHGQCRNSQGWPHQPQQRGSPTTALRGVKRAGRRAKDRHEDRKRDVRPQTRLRLPSATIVRLGFATTGDTSNPDRLRHRARVLFLARTRHPVGAGERTAWRQGNPRLHRGRRPLRATELHRLVVASSEAHRRLPIELGRGPLGDLRHGLRRRSRTTRARHAPGDLGRASVGFSAPARRLRGYRAARLGQVSRHAADARAVSRLERVSMPLSRESGITPPSHPSSRAPAPRLGGGGCNPGAWSPGRAARSPMPPTDAGSW